MSLTYSLNSHLAYVSNISTFPEEICVVKTNRSMVGFHAASGRPETQEFFLLSIFLFNRKSNRTAEWATKRKCYVLMISDVMTD